MKALQILPVIALMMISATSFAIDDTPENRLVEMKRYLEAVPPDEIFADMADGVAMNFPPSERAEFRDFMTKYVDIDVISEAMEASMLKHFTADELAAIADLYTSPVGQSAMKKMGVYMAEVMPIIEAEVMRALGELQKAKAEENRQLPNDEE